MRPVIPLSFRVGSVPWVPTAMLVVGVLSVTGGACVAPLLRGPAREPTRHLFVGAHGVPNAYGDGVCAFTARHTHAYPPVPQSAFDLEDDAWRDRRPMYPFFDPHAHPQRSCFRVGWHLHLEPPLPTLRYRSDVAAFAETGDVAVAVYPGPHPGCTVEAPHGHLPPRVRPRVKPEKRLRKGSAAKTRRAGAGVTQSH